MSIDTSCHASAWVVSPYLAVIPGKTGSGQFTQGMKFRNALLPTGTEISVISTGLGSGPDERGFEERVWLGRECRVVAYSLCNFRQRLLQRGLRIIVFIPFWHDHSSQQ